jgi:hypothetical protein
VNDTSNQLPEFMQGVSDSDGKFLQYIQSLAPETIAQLSKPSTPEVLQMMERNIVGLLGGLPPENFDVTITTSREALGRLLISAMMGGYFLKSAEQRLAFEKSLQSVDVE